MRQAGEWLQPRQHDSFPSVALPLALLKQMVSRPEVVAAGVSPPCDLFCTAQTLFAGHTHGGALSQEGVRQACSSPLSTVPPAHTSCQEGPWGSWEGAGQGHFCRARAAQRRTHHQDHL